MFQRERSLAGIGQIRTLCLEDSGPIGRSTVKRQTNESAVTRTNNFSELPEPLNYCRTSSKNDYKPIPGESELTCAGVPRPYAVRKHTWQVWEQNGVTAFPAHPFAGLFSGRREPPSPRAPERRSISSISPHLPRTRSEALIRRSPENRASKTEPVARAKI